MFRVLNYPIYNTIKKHMFLGGPVFVKDEKTGKFVVLGEWVYKNFIHMLNSVMLIMLISKLCIQSSTFWLIFNQDVSRI